MKLRYQCPKGGRVKKGSVKSQHPFNPKIHRGKYFSHVLAEKPGASIWFDEYGNWVDTYDNPNNKGNIHDVLEIMGITQLP